MGNFPPPDEPKPDGLPPRKNLPIGSSSFVGLKAGGRADGLGLPFENWPGRGFESRPEVCRTGSHLFELLANLDAVGKGWGRGIKRAVGRWYTAPSEDELVFGAVKYAGRSGDTHRDALLLAHPKSDSAALGWIVRGGETPNEFAAAAERIKGLVGSLAEAAGLVASARLPREAVPTELLGSPEIWRALLPAMPMTALVRNLGKMTAVGVFEDAASLEVALAKLTDETALRRGRMHPLSLLVALKVYGSGRGVPGLSRVVA